jgi:hypothetical protein
MQSTSVKNSPFGIVAQMGDISNVFIAVLLNLHLFGGMSPRKKIHLAALSIKRKVGHFNQTARVQTYLGNPSYYA